LAKKLTHLLVGYWLTLSKAKTLKSEDDWKEAVKKWLMKNKPSEGWPK
jgi:hypothetical protein